MSDGAQGKNGSGLHDHPLNAAEQRLFEALRALRTEIAGEQGIPPYVVASDRTLRDLARKQPTRPEQLTTIYGIGERKAEAYGARFLKVILEVVEDWDAP